MYAFTTFTNTSTIPASSGPFCGFITKENYTRVHLHGKRDSTNLKGPKFGLNLPNFSNKDQTCQSAEAENFTEIEQSEQLQEGIL